MTRSITRRNLLASVSAAALPWACSGPKIRLAAFEADVTPPLGTPFLNGVLSRSIADPLYAKGIVLLGAGDPLVITAVDWCEIRNESYERWRSELSAATGTTPQRVLVSCVHQHDAPYVDSGAQRLLKEAGEPGDLCHPETDEAALQRVAAALRQRLAQARPITAIGTGRGKTEKLVSNRRYVSDEGAVSWSRTSATRDPGLRAKPPGLNDPWVSTLSFWENDQPVAALSCFSIHPMSYYGHGDTSADFVGMARARLQKDTPGVMQIYLSGCSGDTIAGIYNDGSPEMRPVLADRLYQGLAGAWQTTTRQPLEGIGFRSIPMRLAPRQSPEFSLESLQATLNDNTKTFRERYPAALGLSWRRRVDAGHAIDVPAIDFGPGQFVLLPAEAFVQYQLWAQQIRPESLVLAAGYGECAPGYIPTAQDAAEGYDDHYSWIAFPECEYTIRQALAAALTPE